MGVQGHYPGICTCELPGLSSTAKRLALETLQTTNRRKAFCIGEGTFFFLPDTSYVILEPILIHHCKTSHRIFIFYCSSTWVLHQLLALKMGLDDKAMSAVKHVFLPVCHFFVCE